MPCFEKFLENAENALRNCEQQFSKIRWAAGEDKTRRPADERNRNLARALCRDLIGFMEMITYFLVYRKGDFAENVDVRSFDEQFTRNVHVDYFPRNGWKTTRTYDNYETQSALSRKKKDFLKERKVLHGVKNRSFVAIEQDMRENATLQPKLASIPFFKAQSPHQLSNKYSCDLRFVDSIMTKVHEALCFRLKDLQNPLDEENLVWGEIPEDDLVWTCIEHVLDWDHVNVMLNLCNEIYEAIAINGDPLE